MFCFNKRLFITFGKLHFKHSPSTRSKRHTQLHYALFTNYKSKTKNKILFICCSWPKCGSGTSVGIGTRYWLDGGGIESQWEARISAPVQTGPGAHPASCKMGTRTFPGIKSGRGVKLTPHPLLVPLVMKEYSYTSTPPMGRTACTEPQCLYKGALYLFFYLGENGYIFLTKGRQLSVDVCGYAPIDTLIAIKNVSGNLFRNVTTKFEHILKSMKDSDIFFY